MKTLSTDYGEVRILTHEEIYQHTLDFIKAAAVSAGDKLATVGLTGGSTPKAFYQWVNENDALPLEIAKKVLWTTSDERCVPLDDDDNNFGHAVRGMLDPLGLPAENKLAWPTELEPAECAAKYQAYWDFHYGADTAYDVCFVGMGGDNHTLSLFPECPLIKEDPQQNFASTLWPSRGWRVTLTVAGLARCKQIVVSTTGEGKAEALKKAIRGEYDPFHKPVQLVREHAAKTVWLVDEPAAALL